MAVTSLPPLPAFVRCTRTCCRALGVAGEAAAGRAVFSGRLNSRQPPLVTMCDQFLKGILAETG
jgi:hypothetical protein